MARSQRKLNPICKAIHFLFSLDDDLKIVQSVILSFYIISISMMSMVWYASLRFVWHFSISLIKKKVPKFPSLLHGLGLIFMVSNFSSFFVIILFRKIHYLLCHWRKEEQWNKNITTTALLVQYSAAIG